MTDLQKVTITQMRSNGMSFGQISAATSIPAATIRTFCRRQDIKVETTANIGGFIACKCCGRNTVDSLTTVRKLKDRGIEVYFEKENIWTLDSKGELLITIMSSLAQEESRSISENTTWGKRKSFADGKASVAYSRFLGYDEGFKINEEQAKTVRLIYKLYLSVLSITAIVKRLEQLGRKTASGGKSWCISSVRGVLTNEKYMGDALLQKSYTVDFLNKKRIVNKGEVQQYYVEDHHQGIVTKDEFEAVQAEMSRRSGKNYSGVSIFSSKIVCGDCGGFYGSKVWHSTDKYRRVIWRCNRKYKKGEKKCRTGHLTEDEIKAAFVKTVNKLSKEKDEVLSNMEVLMETISDVAVLETEKIVLEAELAVLVEKTKGIIAENAHTAQDQQEYENRYNSLASQYDAKKARYDELEEQIADANASGQRISGFISHLKNLDGSLEAFDEELWGGMVENMTVRAKEGIEVTFKGGATVKVG